MVLLSVTPASALALLLSSTLATAAHPANIRLTPGLPDTLSLDASTPLVATWDALFPSLSSRAARLLSGFLARQADAHRSMAGVPGTAIAESAEALILQEHLDCHAARGEWVYDPQGARLLDRAGGARAGLTVHKQEVIYASCDKHFYKKHAATHGDVDADEWAVRESAKWRWVPSRECDASRPGGQGARAEPKLSRKGLCELLAHKAVLMAGDVPQFGLHDLLLDWTSVRPQSCYGDLYCKEHLLCADVLDAKGDIEGWATDERVYDTLPPPPTHSHKREQQADHADDHADDHDHDHDHDGTAEDDNFSIADDIAAIDASSSSSPLEKRARYSSAAALTSFRYRRTDGLRYTSGATHPTFVNPATGVREVNQPWIADSRRSDVVIVSKPPLPLPLAGKNATWDSWWAENAGGAVGAQRVLEAAWRITEDVWLPELVDTLKAARGPPSPVEQLIVFRGGWRMHADCAAEVFGPEDRSAVEGEWDSPGDGPPPHARQPSLETLLFRTGAAAGPHAPLQPLHALFFNLQTVIQNHVVRTSLLPALGIPFLDLETPLAVWRSGMVGGSAAGAFATSPAPAPGLVDQTKPQGGSVGLRSAASGDCLRYCFPGPGMAIEEAFIGGLMRVMGRGWAGDDERRKRWVGEGYEDVKTREGKRAKRAKGGKA